MKRREVLLGEKKIDFIEENEEVEGETKRGDELNLVKIVFEQLTGNFKDDPVVFREAKRMLQNSKFISTESKDLI